MDIGITHLICPNNFAFDKSYIDYLNSLDAIAGKTKVMPRNFFDKKNFDVTKEFLDYCKPLIGNKFLETMSII